MEEEGEEEEVKKRKGKRQREENRGSCVDALKLFRAATNLRAAHGSYVWDRLAVFLFSPVVLTGQLGANHRSKVICQALYILFLSIYTIDRISTHKMRHNTFSMIG